MPVPTALIPSQATNVPAANKAARKAAHHHSRRSVLGPKASISTYAAGVYDQIPIASHRLGRGGRAVVEDENTPYDMTQFAYNGHQHSKSMSSVSRPFAQSVIGVHPQQQAPTATNAVGGMIHVHQSASNASKAGNHNFRRSLANWPPSPPGLPPTPTFDLDVPYSSIDSSIQHDAWLPAAPSANNNIESHSINTSIPVLVSEEDAMDITAAADEYSPEVDEDAIRKLVPSPSELLRSANEQARANAATGLSDWMSEAIWEMSRPMMDGYESPSSPSSRRSSLISPSSSVPTPFKRFASQTIYQVSASSGSLLLALWYVSRLPIGPAYLATGEKVAFGEKERAFREDLLATRSEIPWRLLVLGLTLSNKWLEDNTFTTKTWNEVTALGVTSMKTVESKALAIFDWVLNPNADDWLKFLHVLRQRELLSMSTRGAQSPIGSERRLSMSIPRNDSTGKRPLRAIDELIADVAASVGAFDPVFPGDASPINSGMTSPVSPATSVTESIGSSTYNQPRPISPPQFENTWNNRPASWTDMRNHAPEGLVTLSHCQELPARGASEDMMSRYLSRRVNTPAAWDPTRSNFDSPLLREGASRKQRPMYEAVQRPSSLLLIPPPPRFEDYAYNAPAIPRAKYDDYPHDRSLPHEGMYVPPVSFPQHFESGGVAVVGDRSWYDAKLTRSIMPVDSHGSSWATTFAGVISSF